MSLKKLACVVAAVFSLASGAAAAATITFQFSGAVTYGAPMAVPAGTRIVGTFSYDTSTLPAITYKGFADYQVPAPFMMSATVGGHSISTGNLSVSVWNHFKGNVEDMVQVFGGSVVLDGTTLPNGTLGFQLASGPRKNGVLNSTKLPSTYNVSEFDADPNLTYGTFQSDGGPQGTLLQFTVDSIIVLQATP